MGLTPVADCVFADIVRSISYANKLSDLYLNFAYCEFSEAQLCHLFGNLQRCCECGSFLTSLDLAFINVRIPVRPWCEMFRAVCGIHLSEVVLLLSDCGLTAEAMESLSLVWTLPVLRRIQLDVSCNDVGDTGIGQLFLSTADNEDFQQAVLTLCDVNIDISQMQVSMAGFAIVCRFLQRLLVLKKVVFGFASNPLPADDAAVLLANVFACKPVLVESIGFLLGGAPSNHIKSLFKQCGRHVEIG